MKALPENINPNSYAFNHPKGFIKTNYSFDTSTPKRNYVGEMVLIKKDGITYIGKVIEQEEIRSGITHWKIEKTDPTPKNMLVNSQT